MLGLGEPKGPGGSLSSAQWRFSSVWVKKKSVVSDDGSDIMLLLRLLDAKLLLLICFKTMQDWCEE
jgi:hypothetical protein